MTGSLRIENGKYYAVLNLKNEIGKRKQKVVPLYLKAVAGSKRKANELLRSLLAEYEKKHPVVYRDILFADFVSVWLSEAQERLQQNTYEAYKNTVDIHIIPHFKEKRILLNDVKYSDIKAYYTEKSKTLSSNSLKKHHSIIKQTLRKAVQDGFIYSNPANEIQLPKSKRYVGKYLSKEQSLELLKVAKGTVLEPVVTIALMFGLRRSEIAGLKWNAIDFEQNTLTISHTVTRYSSLLAKDGTKNKTSYRIMPMNPTAKTFLLELKQKQEKEQTLLGGAYIDNDYICRWSDGHPINPSYMSHAFSKLLQKNCIEPLRLHDLRHTNASLLLQMGESMKTISDWLGHSDIGTSMNLYAHVSLEAKKETSNKLGEMLSL